MKHITKLLAISAVLIITAQPVMAQAPVETKKVLSVQQTIAFYAASPKDESELLKVAKCESTFNPKARGDKNKAVGVFQYHEPTFITFSKLMGEELDYYSYTDQARLTAFIWKNYPQYKKHWTCSKITGVIS